MTDRDPMQIPEGYSCADCVAFQRCKALIGEAHIHDKQTRCDWSPSRFAISRFALERRIQAKDEEIDQLLELLERAHEFVDTYACMDERQDTERALLIVDIEAALFPEPK